MKALSNLKAVDTDLQAEPMDHSGTYSLKNVSNMFQICFVAKNSTYTCNFFMRFCSCCISCARMATCAIFAVRCWRYNSKQKSSTSEEKDCATCSRRLILHSTYKWVSDTTITSWRRLRMSVNGSRKHVNCQWTNSKYSETRFNRSAKSKDRDWENGTGIMSSLHWGFVLSGLVNN